MGQVRTLGSGGVAACVRPVRQLAAPCASFTLISRAPHQVIAFVKATVDLILGFIDGAIDYLIDLLVSLLIDGIPELKTLFTPFDFDLYWDDLINIHIFNGEWYFSKACVCLSSLFHSFCPSIHRRILPPPTTVNASLVEMFDKLSDTFSLDNLSPHKDVATFMTSVIAPAITFASREVYDRVPQLNFTCAAGFIPIVMTLDYTADNCNLDLGPSFRFPCIGLNSTCTRRDLEQVGGGGGGEGTPTHPLTHPRHSNRLPIFLAPPSSLTSLPPPPL